MEIVEIWGIVDDNNKVISLYLTEELAHHIVNMLKENNPESMYTVDYFELHTFTNEKMVAI